MFASHEFLLAKNEIFVVPDLRGSLEDHVFNVRDNLL